MCKRQNLRPPNRRFTSIASILFILLCILVVLTSAFILIKRPAIGSVHGAYQNTTASNPGISQFAKILEKVNPLSQAASSGSADCYQVHFIDVGMGDSELIVTPHKKTILIDGGERGSGVVDYIKSIGVDRIDLMILSHPHSDHMGGLIDVLQVFPVGKVITNGRSYSTSTYDDFLGEVIRSKAEFIEVNRGDSIALDGIKLFVISPDKSFPTDDMNESSLMLRMESNGKAILFAGDAGETSEYLAEKAGYDLRSDILKVGHHGSGSSTSEPFLKYVSPDIAIVSVGKNNDFDLPNPDTLTRLKSNGIQLFRTDKDGTIIFTFTNGKFVLTTEKSGTQPVCR